MKKNAFIIVLAVVMTLLVGCAEPEPPIKSYTVTVRHEGSVTLPDEISTVKAGEKYVVKTYAIEGYKPSYSDGLSAGDEIELSSDLTITITWESDPVSFFAAGSGTKDDPYVIKNEHQFANIYHFSEMMAVSKANYLYFSIESDLDFSKGDECPLIPVFRGELDFNGHTVAGIDNVALNSKKTSVHKYLLTKYSGFPEAYGWIQIFISGKICNLNMKIYDSISMITWGNSIEANAEMSDDKTIEINNVIVSSDDVVVLNGDTNFSGFISQCFDTKLRFVNCTNEVSYVGGSYGSAFLGGYGLRSELFFDSCVNKGSITATKAGFLVGNDANSETSVINVTNCKNENLIQGTVSSGFYTNSDKAFEKTNDDETSTGKDKVKTLGAVSNVEVSVDEEGYFVVNSTNDTYCSFKIQGSTYRQVYDGTENVGTYLFTVSSSFASGEKTGLKKLKAIDIKAFGETKPNVSKDALGYAIVEKDGETYYYNDSTPVKEGDVTGFSSVIGSDKTGYISTLKYMLFCYGADGSVVGSMEIK